MSQGAVQSQSAKTGWNWPLWGRWVAANAIAETIGLGSSALLWVAFIFVLESQLGVVVSAVIVVLGSTLLEGTAVGLGQWWVLRRALPQLKWQSWLLATAVGALVAWSLGMIPSTMMTLGAEATAEPPPQISGWVVYGLAAVMGLVLGPILALPQWWVLRRHLRRAAWWIPANALAWAPGMVVIFIGVGLVAEGALTGTAVLIILFSLALAGAVVGAGHGLVLLWLLHSQPAER